MYQWNRNSMKYKMSVSMKIKIGNAMYHFSCNVIVGLHISQSAWCGLVIRRSSYARHLKQSLAYAGRNTKDVECKHKWHAHMNMCVQLAYWTVPYCPIQKDLCVIWRIMKTCGAIKLGTSPKHAHTCIATHVVWHVSCGTDPWHCVWHMPLHVSCGTSCDSGVPWLRHIRHLVHTSSHVNCASVQIPKIAIWDLQSGDSEISRLWNLEIAKSTDCEIWRLRHLRLWKV